MPFLCKAVECINQTFVTSLQDIIERYTPTQTKQKENRMSESQNTPYLSCGRSNQFRVKDLSAFKQALTDFDVSVVEDDNDPNLVSILAFPRPGISFTNDQQHVLETVVPHMAGRGVVILMQVGYRSDTLELMGNAVAVNSKGEMRQVDLAYIYQMAKGLVGEDVEVATCAD
jgi:hypothetical protein